MMTKMITKNEERNLNNEKFQISEEFNSNKEV